MDYSSQARAAGAKKPLLLIHGGAGQADREKSFRKEAGISLQKIIDEVWSILSPGGSATDAVIRAVELLEAAPCFNAGLGAALQSDGQARLSASLMDGEKERFSGVALVTNLIHPIQLAKALQARDHRVLGPMGAQLLARELKMPPENPVTPYRAANWQEHLEQNSQGKYGTVGAVALDSQGRMAAATSTGGIGNEYPERMSDVTTPAGNYSTKFAAISCTGTGEHIVEQGVGVRLETRVRDGMTILEASDLLLKETRERGNDFAWIAIDKNGNWVINHTTDHIYAAARSFDIESALILS